MKKEGFVLVVAIFIVIVFAVLGMVVVSLMSGEAISTLKDYNSVRAFHLAEAGLQYTMAASLAADTDWSDNTGFTKNLSPGYFTVSYLYRTRRQCTLRVTGVAGGISRTVIAGIKKTIFPGAFEYGVCSFNVEGKPLYIENTVTIYGDFYYLGSVTMMNNSKLVNGTMFSQELELLHQATVASWEQAPEVETPQFDDSYYYNLLQETTKTATSALNISSGTLNLGGGTYYYTSIQIGGDAIVNGPGTLVATTGNFTLQNTAQMGDNISVIVKGSTYFMNSSLVGADLQVTSQGSIYVNNSQNVPKEAVFFSYGDISFDNTSQYWGSILAPSGEVSSVNSTTFNGLIYAYSINLQNSTHLNGASAVSDVGYIRNSSVITYDPSKLPSTLPRGFGEEGESTKEGLAVSDWMESF